MKKRRSAHVSAVLVAQMALLAGCDGGGDLDKMAEGPTQAQICADKDGVIVSDEMCQQNTKIVESRDSHGNVIFVPSYGWSYYPYYGGGGSGYVPRVGSRVPATATPSPASGIQAVRPNSPGFGSIRSGSGSSGGRSGFGGSSFSGGGS